MKLANEIWKTMAMAPMNFGEEAVLPKKTVMFLGRECM